MQCRKYVDCRRFPRLKQVMTLNQLYRTSLSHSSPSDLASKLIWQLYSLKYHILELRTFVLLGGGGGREGDRKWVYTSYRTIPLLNWTRGYAHFPAYPVYFAFKGDHFSF